MAERVRMVLVCSECNARNYPSTKKKVANSVRIELRKFCKTCDKHTLHIESK